MMRSGMGRWMKKERDILRGIRLFCILAAGAFLLPACEKTVVNDKDRVVVQPESAERLSDFEYQQVAESESGYYFWERFTPSQFYPRLMFMDKESGRTVPLCSKPDCSHVGKECNAYFPEMEWGENGFSKDYLQYYEGSLYSVGLTEDSYAAIFCIKADGSEWEISTKLYRTDYGSSGHWRTPEILINGGDVYFIDNKQDHMKLERIPLGGGLAETVFEVESDAVYVQVYRMEANAGDLFFQVFIIMNDGNSLTNGDLYRYHMASRQCSLIKEGIFSPYSVQDGFVYYGSSEGLCRYSIKDDVIQVLNDRSLDVPNITLTKDYIVLCRQMSDNILTLYDYEGNELATVPNMLGLHWYFGGNADKLFGECTDEVGLKLCYLDLTRPLDELQWEELKAE